jgi:hypothetical protein
VGGHEVHVGDHALPIVGSLVSYHHDLRAGRERVLQPMPELPFYLEKVLFPFYAQDHALLAEERADETAELPAQFEVD